MQVSATLIAAQQAAREARARLQMPQAAPQANFAAALGKTAAPAQGFSALPLKQTAPTDAPAVPQPQTAVPGRLGQHIDITV
ncbi:MAG TPA: hypothetical protein VJP60_04240 [Rhizomicrobium sp.]|nr:hypothetical protein [Rhizomicrobium sp.]